MLLLNNRGGCVRNNVCRLRHCCGGNDWEDNEDAIESIDLICHRSFVRYMLCYPIQFKAGLELKMLELLLVFSFKKTNLKLSSPSQSLVLNPCWIVE